MPFQLLEQSAIAELGVVLFNGTQLAILSAFHLGCVAFAILERLQAHLGPEDTFLSRDVESAHVFEANTGLHHLLLHFFDPLLLLGVALVSEHSDDFLVEEQPAVRIGHANGTKATHVE